MSHPYLIILRSWGRGYILVAEAVVMTFDQHSVYLTFAIFVNCFQVGCPPFFVSIYSGSKLWLPIKITWAAPRPIKSHSLEGGGTAQVISMSPQCWEPQLYHLKTEPSYIYFACLAAKTREVFFFLSWACDSTFCVILGLIFLIYLMEIRMTYFISGIVTIK